MSPIRLYRISIAESALDNLHQKLDNAVFPDKTDAAGWEYEVPLSDVKRVAAHWCKLDRRDAETKLNELPQFTTTVEVDGFDTLDIHYVHKKTGSIPLLFLHGWPGSFLVVTRILPLLTTGDATFDVVAPSLPNFGFFGGVKTKGFALRQYAQAMHRLMLQLGYLGNMGGDWGFFITRTMADSIPGHAKRCTSTTCVATRRQGCRTPCLRSSTASMPYDEREKAGLARTKCFAEQSPGYRLLQATNPQNLGYGLADSPVALLTWLMEKLHDWTDDYPWTDYEICVWVSIYQFSTAGPTASLRIFYEVTQSDDPIASRDAASARGRGQWADVVFGNVHANGGHWPAYEVPEALAGDLKTMFGPGGGAHGVISKRNVAVAEQKLRLRMFSNPP